MCNSFREYIKCRYYSKFDKEKVLQNYNKKSNENIDILLNDFSYIFYYILNTRPCYYFNAEIRSKVVEELSKIIKDNNIRIDTNILRYFFIAYDTYQQITEVMQDMSNLSLEEKLKNRLYRIPTYISITEGCLTNLYKFIVNIIDQSIKEKDYTKQNKLNQLCDVLKNNKFEIIVNDVNVDIRNAINHGGVSLTNNGKDLNFYYMKNGQEAKIKMSYFIFDDLITRLYDACSGIILGITQILNCNINILDKDKIMNNKYLSFKCLALKLSLPTIICSEINDESINNKQLNILTSIDNTNRVFLIQTAIELIVQVYTEYPQYEQYHVNIENDRLLICFIRLTKEDILKFIDNHEMLNKSLENAIKRGDVQVPFPEALKSLTLKEIKYYKYPIYSDDEMKILMVEDISNENRKRLRADLFVGDIEDRNIILKKINSALKWLNEIDNSYTNSKVAIKQGTMNADSIYLNVYHNDIRQGYRIYNENYICFVDYNKDGKTTLKNGGMSEVIWTKLFHEKIENIQIAWRKEKYLKNIE